MLMEQVLCMPKQCSVGMEVKFENPLISIGKGTASSERLYLLYKLSVIRQVTLLLLKNSS